MPVHRQLTFCPRTQYDWIKNGDHTCKNTTHGNHTCKNTTHQNITMHYLEFIFLNCTAIMPPTLPLTFRCLSKLQFPFTWSWKIYHLMSSCFKQLSFYLLKKNVGILINYWLCCNNSHMFLHVHNHQTWTQIVTLPTVFHKS